MPSDREILLDLLQTQEAARIIIRGEYEGNNNTALVVLGRYLNGVLCAIVSKQTHTVKSPYTAYLLAMKKLSQNELSKLQEDICAANRVVKSMILLQKCRDKLKDLEKKIRAAEQEYGKFLVRSEALNTQRNELISNRDMLTGEIEKKKALEFNAEKLLPTLIEKVNSTEKDLEKFSEILKQAAKYPARFSADQMEEAEKNLRQHKVIQTKLTKSVNELQNNLKGIRSNLVKDDISLAGLKKKIEEIEKEIKKQEDNFSFYSSSVDKQNMQEFRESHEKLKDYIRSAIPFLPSVGIRENNLNKRQKQLEKDESEEGKNLINNSNGFFGDDNDRVKSNRKTHREINNPVVADKTLDLSSSDDDSSQKKQRGFIDLAQGLKDKYWQNSWLCNEITYLLRYYEDTPNQVKSSDFDVILDAYSEELISLLSPFTSLRSLDEWQIQQLRDRINGIHLKRLAGHKQFLEEFERLAREFGHTNGRIIVSFKGRDIEMIVGSSSSNHTDNLDQQDKKLNEDLAHNYAYDDDDDDSNDNEVRYKHPFEEGTYIERGEYLALLDEEFQKILDPYNSQRRENAEAIREAEKLLESLNSLTM